LDDHITFETIAIMLYFAVYNLRYVLHTSLYLHFIYILFLFIHVFLLDYQRWILC